MRNGSGTLYDGCLGTAEEGVSFQLGRHVLGFGGGKAAQRARIYLHDGDAIFFPSV